MKEHIRGVDRSVANAAEHEMRRLLLSEKITQRLEREQAADLANDLGPYIAISREAGAGGSEIARRVGEALGWEVLDKELLDTMAERYHLPRDFLEFVDEKTVNWLFESFGKLLQEGSVTQIEYVHHLGKIVLLAATRGKVVFVGRGAQFFLPRDKGLAVRVIASEKYRIEQIMQRSSITHESARRFVAETDEGRRTLIRRYFNHNADDPTLYDLILNVEKLGHAGTATVIVEAYKSWSQRT